MTGPLTRDLYVLGLEYPSAEAALAVFERANAELEDCSVWHTATPDLSRHFLVGLFEDAAAARAFDWGEATVYEPSDEQQLWMLRRRLGRGASAFLEGRERLNERIHYGAGDAPRIPGSA